VSPTASATRLPSDPPRPQLPRARDRLHAYLDAGDEAIERRLGRVRNSPTLDTAAIVTSNLADYGAVWLVVGAVKAARDRSSRQRVVTALAVAGVSSTLVNWTAKQLVGRSRPEGPEPTSARGVRRPTSSSFPSGHTLAAWCTAVVLADSPAEMAAYLAFAGATAFSRVHLRAHHATDVVGGATLGLAVGVIARGLTRRRRRSSRPTIS